MPFYINNDGELLYSASSLKVKREAPIEFVVLSTGEIIITAFRRPLVQFDSWRAFIDSLLENKDENAGIEKGKWFVRNGWTPEELALLSRETKGIQ